MFVPMQARTAIDSPKRLGDPSERINNIHTNVNDFGDKLGSFCVALADKLDEINDHTGDCVLDEVEVHVEMTSRNEVRLVACSGSDVSGAIRLTFRTRRPSSSAEDFPTFTIDGRRALTGAAQPCWQNRENA